jgi:outer membrane protein
MIQVRRLVTMMLTLGISSAAFAQQPVTLTEALQYAMKNSDVIRQAELDIENVEQKVVETRSAALPQINLTSTLNNNLLVQQFVLPAEAFGGTPGEFMSIKAGQEWTAMTQVQLSQQLFNHQVFTGLRAAKSSVEFYELARQVSRENVIQQVATLYYQVIINQEKMNVIQANLDRVEKLENTVAVQFANGLAKKIDLDRIKVNKINIQTQQTQLEVAIVQQENLLKFYMGMPIQEQITLVSDEIIEGIEIPQDALEQENFVAVESLYAYKLLNKQKDLLIFQRKATTAEYIPTLSLGANYTYNTQSNELNLYTSKSLNYDMASIGLTLRVPIFDGFNKRARSRQNSISISKVEEDMKKTVNSLNMAYDNAKNKIKNSLMAIQSQSANKALAEEVFASIQNNYKNGLATLTDLLNAETELVTAQNAYNEALLNYKVAELELKKANGEINKLID